MDGRPSIRLEMQRYLSSEAYQSEGGRMAGQVYKQGEAFFEV